MGKSEFLLSSKTEIILLHLLMFFFFYVFKFYLLIFGPTGLSLLHAGFSLVVGSRATLAVVCRFLTEVASLVAEHRLKGTRASVVAAGGP